MKNDALYITVDVKRTGPVIGTHSMLSIGACVVTRKDLSLSELHDRDQIFYVEMKPVSHDYDIPRFRADGARLASLHETKATEPLFCPVHSAFNPRMTLQFLQDTGSCVSPGTAIRSFDNWFRSISRMKHAIAVIRGNADVFGWVNHYCGKYGGINPIFECGGVDLSSLWMGTIRTPADPNIETIGVEYDRALRHRADHDAVWLAKTARVVLYENLGW